MEEESIKIESIHSQSQSQPSTNRKHSQGSPIVISSQKPEIIEIPDSEGPNSTPKPSNRINSRINSSNQRKSIVKLDDEETCKLKVYSIELENFKSYFGKTTIGPFDEEFSAVVGPNGSGKSNLLESLIFIFGHRASRMRLKKLTELIHNSNDHPSCSYASVTVNFNEVGARGEVLKKFSIRRTVYKESSGTKYFIDERESKKDEVVELLLSKGVDLVNNRFLILQGEVEQIASMEPKGKNEDNPGLLEYLEEIIGSNNNVKKIQLYTNQIEELTIDKNEKHSIYDDSKKSLDSLNHHKEKVFNLLTLDKQIVCIKHCSYSLIKYNNKKKLDQKRAQKKELKKELKKVEIEQKEFNTKNSDVTASIEAFRKQKEDLEKKISKNNKEVKKSKNKIDTLNEEKHHYGEKELNC